MTKIWLYLLLFVALSFKMVAHPFYVSITTINHNKQNGKVEITMRLFLDDVERRFEVIEGKKLNLGDKLEVPNAKEKLNQYLKKSFSMEDKLGEIPYNILGHEIEEDILWLYMEATYRNENFLKIKNSVLTDVYDGQSNMVHLHLDGEKKSVILNKEKTNYEF